MTSFCQDCGRDVCTPLAAQQCVQAAS